MRKARAQAAATCDLPLTPFAPAETFTILIFMVLYPTAIAT